MWAGNLQQLDTEVFRLVGATPDPRRGKSLYPAIKALKADVPVLWLRQIVNDGLPTELYLLNVIVKISLDLVVKPPTSQHTLDSRARACAESVFLKTNFERLLRFVEVQAVLVDLQPALDIERAGLEVRHAEPANGDNRGQASGLGFRLGNGFVDR